MVKKSWPSPGFCEHPVVSKANPRKAVAAAHHFRWPDGLFHIVFNVSATPTIVLGIRQQSDISGLLISVIDSGEHES